MKFSEFEIKKTAEQLIDMAVGLWRRSGTQSELGHVEEDPVFKMLMTAVAYQWGEANLRIDSLKADLLRDFINYTTPYAQCGALPASVTVRANPNQNIDEGWLNESTYFTLNGTGFRFIPLLNTKLTHVGIETVERIDGRRWKVKLPLPSSLESIGGLTFAINSPYYSDLRITATKREIPLIKPWEYSELPFNKCFDPLEIPAEGGNSMPSASIWLETMAFQNLRFYYILPDEAAKVTNPGSMELIMEFMGIDGNFTFDKSLLQFNCVPLANISLATAWLDNEHPATRISGDAQFVGLYDNTQQIDARDYQIEIRRVATDRFNRPLLINLAQELINRFDSDYYAFSQTKALADGKIINQMKRAVNDLSESLREEEMEAQGIYLILHTDDYSSKKKNLSVEVKYLTTNGAAVNSVLTADSKFLSPAIVDQSTIKVISKPVGGIDASRFLSKGKGLVAYRLNTNDRLVTPMDYKLFVKKELQRRFDIPAELIKNIRVTTRRERMRRESDYVLQITVTLSDNPILTRMIAGKVEYIKLLLQKAMEVRSTQVLKIEVNILQESKPKKENQ